MPTKSELKQAAGAKVMAIIAENIDFNGISYINYYVEKGEWAGVLAQAKFEDPNAKRVFALPNGMEYNALEMTNAEYIAMVESWLEKRQKAYNAYKAISDAIDEETITEYAEVDSAWAASIASYVAPALLPTVTDVQNALTALESVVSPTAIASALAGKVDVVSGKQLTTEDYTTVEKTKLAGIASGATANMTNAALLSRANHTGTQAVDTITDLPAVLLDILSRIVTLENWKSAIKLAKAEAFKVTTDSNGDVTVNTSTAFTSPIGIATPQATAGSEGYHAHVTSVSGTTIKFRVFKNKTQGVLLGGTIDPDEVATSTSLNMLVVQSS